MNDIYSLSHTKWNCRYHIMIAGQSNAVGCTNISVLGDEWVSEQFPCGMLYQEGNFDPYSYGAEMLTLGKRFGIKISELQAQSLTT